MQTLKEARQAKGVSQKAVAAHVGVSRVTYARYEKDQERMTVAQAKAACEFIGVPFRSIFLSSGVR